MREFLLGRRRLTTVDALQFRLGDGLQKLENGLPGRVPQVAKGVQKPDFLVIKWLRDIVGDQGPRMALQRLPQAQQPIGGEPSLAGFEIADLLIGGAHQGRQPVQREPPGLPKHPDPIVHALCIPVG